ncbi:thiamine phosphate synthase [Marinibactrum halimedae]|uniref:Thiamine-phosphate synthase n=1 Tax=Marinibactrum halimedae TaxID=1444977 RepID=A0AA37TBA4_9GAMM|nr:thiamine phosphate synthase [Marinibactrum halimedae]MCD9458687.1 thiamine phosphate synthase [Marinibactrum halimedae]GLS25947.1 thiamine-phosphate pyrophosphorylase [Marinibactrum halimedae]
MTQYTPEQSSVVLAIGGIDPAGFSGLQADIKALHSIGAHCYTVPTAMTAQPAQAGEPAQVYPVSTEEFVAQLNACLSHERPSAIKVGLMPNQGLAIALKNWIGEHNLTEIPVVYDPVFANTLNKSLLVDPPQVIVERLLPITTLMTPNLLEAALWSEQIATEDADLSKPETFARQWRKAGAQQILVKGGHSDDSSSTDSNMVSDYFIGLGTGGPQAFWVSTPKLPLNQPCRGTGCSLASLIAGMMGFGYSAADAVVIAKQRLQEALFAPLSFGEFLKPNFQAIKPATISSTEAAQIPLEKLPSVHFPSQPYHFNFPSCGDSPLGLYPVVDSAEWIERLLSLGVTTIQLRAKNLKGEALEREIQSAIAIAERFNTRLFINDYWELAIKHGAYGVHLGYEDLQTADLHQLEKHQLRLGLSTHCHYELAHALSVKPSYVASGPVFHTNTKDMPWRPQGIDGVSYWRKLVDCPLVAIGGLNESHFKALCEAGADGIAMITAITHAKDAEGTTQRFMDIIKSAVNETYDQKTL